MKVRPATTDDLYGLALLAREMHDMTLYAGLHFSPAQTARWLDGAIADPDWLVLVVEEKRRVVGALVAVCSTCFFGPERVATEKAVFVSPLHRGGAAIRLLVSGYLKWAEEAGCREAYLASSTGYDVSALYNRLGFPQIGTVHRARLGG